MILCKLHCPRLLAVGGWDWGWFQELTKTQLFGDQGGEPPRPSHTKCDQMCWWDLEEGPQDWVGRRRKEEQTVAYTGTRGTLGSGQRSRGLHEEEEAARWAGLGWASPPATPQLAL